jgi:2-iminobutanoate/2-iminopropanoate deaminase
MTGRAASVPIVPAAAPAPIGPYAPGRIVVGPGRWIITSGQTGIDPETGKLIDGDVVAQTDRVLRNLRAVLQAGAADLPDVVKTTVFLADMADFAAMNEVYARAFGDHKPARTTVAVKGLPLNCLVEIEAWAFRP